IPNASSQIVELKRAFMTSSKNLSPRIVIAESLNHRNREYVRQAAQVHHERQSIVMPQHPAAMGHLARRLIDQSFLRRRIRTDHFVRRDPNAQILAAVIALQ